MMLFSTVEGSVSHSGRKRSACIKVLSFTIWNVFFVNVLSGSIMGQLNAISSVKTILNQLAAAVPIQVIFPWFLNWSISFHMCHNLINNKDISKLIASRLNVVFKDLFCSPVANVTGHSKKNFTIPLFLFQIAEKHKK